MSPYEERPSWLCFQLDVRLNVKSMKVIEASVNDRGMLSCFDRKQTKAVFPLHQIDINNQFGA